MWENGWVSHHSLLWEHLIIFFNHMAHKINFIFIKLFILLICISASIPEIFNNFFIEATLTWDYILLDIDKYL